MTGPSVRIAKWAHRSALVRRFGSVFGRPLQPERWIFIVGCYNSGTTLLSKVLGAHPQIAALPIEGVFLTDSLPYPEQFGWTRMWFRCLDQVRLDPGVLPPDAIERIKKQWSLWVPRRARNVLEKSVANSVRMPFLEAHFSPAYFIGVVRNGYAVAEGIRRRSRPQRWGNPEFSGTYPIELCAEQWKASDEIITRDSQLVQRFIQVQYEDLVEQPEAVLRRITDHLGLPPLDSEILSRTWTWHGRDEPIHNKNKASLDQLTREDRKAVEQVAGAVLRKYGYPEIG